MREFLEDAESNRADGYRAAQKHARHELPKRFYTEAGVKPVDGGFAVTLDGKATRTPGKVPVVVPVAALATAMAAEWAAQGERLDPAKMSLIRLINSALESGESKIPAMREEIVKYAANDLLLYRADTPQSLVDAQEQHWDAALVKLARHFGVGFQPTIGILHQPQPETTLARLTTALREEGLLVVTALSSITTLTGSALLAVALWQRLLTADEVWAAAHVDEDHQIGLWGEVEEATVRRARRKGEFDAAVMVVEAMRGI